MTNRSGDNAAVRRAVIVAGHTGDLALAQAGCTHHDAGVRSAALGALVRLGALSADTLAGFLLAANEPEISVRRRAAELAATFVEVSLLPALQDPAWEVLEMACWSVGEHEVADDETLNRLIELAGTHEESLVREAAVAALGAVGDVRGLPAIIAATSDKAPVRRRAAVSLAPFEEPEAEEALRGLLSDRDWQTRQIAEDLLDERPSAEPA